MIGNLYTNIACDAFSFLQFLEYKVKLKKYISVISPKSTPTEAIIYEYYRPIRTNGDLSGVGWL